MHEVLKNFGDVKDGSGAHSFRVLLESVLPVSLGEKLVAAEVVEQLIDVFPVNDLAEPDVACVCGRHHYQDVVGADSEEVEPFELARYQTIGNLFNYSNPVIRVDNLVANLKLIHMAVKAAAIVVAGRAEGQPVLRLRRWGNRAFHQWLRWVTPRREAGKRSMFTVQLSFVS